MRAAARPGAPPPRGAAAPAPGSGPRPQTRGGGAAASGVCPWAQQEAAERDLQKESDALTLAIAAAKEDLESTVKEIASTTNRTMNSEIKGLEEDIKDI